MDPAASHEQRIRPARLGLLLTAVAAAFGCAGGAINISGGPWGAVGLLGLFMLLFAWLASAFWELRFEVGANEVLASWGGVFTRRVALADIRQAAVVPYPARKFMGWGYRWWKGDWALSDLGCPDALEITLANGKSVCVTLRDPQAALMAVKAAAPAG